MGTLPARGLVVRASTS